MLILNQLSVLNFCGLALVERKSFFVKLRRALFKSAAGFEILFGLALGMALIESRLMPALISRHPKNNTALHRRHKGFIWKKFSVKFCKNTILSKALLKDIDKCLVTGWKYSSNIDFACITWFAKQGIFASRQNVSRCIIFARQIVSFIYTFSTCTKTYHVI